MHQADNCFDWTPIMIAAREGNVEKVRCLIEIGESVFASNAYGYTPLSLAVLSKNIETFKYIFQHIFTSTPEKLKEDKIAFGIACYEGAIEIVTTFLESNLYDVNETLLYGLPSILLSASNNSVEAAKILLKAGANKYARNFQSQNAYDIAIYRKDRKMQALLSENPNLTPIPHLKTTCFVSTPLYSNICIPSNKIYNNANTPNDCNLRGNNLYTNFPSYFKSNKTNDNHLSSHSNMINGLLSPQILSNIKRKIDFLSPNEEKPVSEKKLKSKDEGCLQWINYGKSLFKRTPKKREPHPATSEEKKLGRNVEITLLLTRLHLEEYISTFILHEVDVNAVLQFTNQDLIDIGITDSIKQREILNNISSFAGDNLNAQQE